MVALPVSKPDGNARMLRELVVVVLVWESAAPTLELVIVDPAAVAALGVEFNHLLTALFMAGRHTVDRLFDQASNTPVSFAVRMVERTA